MTTSVYRARRIVTCGPWCDTEPSRLVLLGVRSMLELALRERNYDGTP
jgi:hypothetical protein